MNIIKLCLFVIILNLSACYKADKNLSLNNNNLYSPESKIIELLKNYNQENLKYFQSFFVIPRNANFFLFKNKVIQLKNKKKLYFQDPFLKETKVRKISNIFASEKELVSFLSKCKISISYLFVGNKYLTMLINSPTREDKKHLFNLRKLIFLQLTKLQ